ncbi:MAG: InlB B-repeat-containing protein [Clostridia bacterium]|nr:InlB B-repeat-containing protein [Clostridia bacterium]
MIKKRIVALSLCLVMLLGLIPADVGIVMHTQAADSSAQANYAANIGKTATFSAYDPIPITDNPTTMTNIWGTDCEFLSLSSVPDDLLMVITNYYLSADGNLWYKVKAADGHTLPEKLLNHPWVYQDNVNDPMGASLIIHENGGSYRPNYGAAIGNTARVDLNTIWNFLVFGDPSAFDYDADWDDENNWLYHDPEDGILDIETDHLFVIRDYYYDEETTALWYRVDAAPGYTLPERMQEATWVFQNYTEIYQEDDWQMLSPDQLIIDDGGRNFVFDAVGNAVTNAEIALYDTLNLTCQSTLTGSVAYQWQIRVGDEWVNIVGRRNATIPADYSLFANAMDANKQAQLRCVSKSGSKTVEGEPITVTVDTDFDYDNYEHPATPDEPKMVKSVRAGGIQPRAEGDTNVCYVTVQYLFENRTQAANSYVAQVPMGVEQTVSAIFPYVQGYLPYYEGERLDELTITDTFNGNEVLTVIYKPTEVNYTVDIYFQNVNNDDYSFYDSKTYQGLTGSPVPLSPQEFPGMRVLLHETPAIAADGTTHVEVYYDRIYYMTRVYLAGGYGIYSVYARYGADLQSHLTAPERPGYSFVGWDEYDVDSDEDGVPDTGGDGIVNTVYPTVPNKHLAYVALWVENATAQVNVVFWGENPNDEGYSYLSTEPLQVKPGLELTYALSGQYVCGLSAHTHGTGCTTNCEKEDHTHSEKCYTLTCTTEPHTHGDECCSHTHTITCFTTATLISQSNLTGNNYRDQRDAINNTLDAVAQEGYVYRYRQSRNTSYYFIYFDGTWYYITNYSNRNTYSQTELSQPNSNGRYTSSVAVCNHTAHNATCFSDCPKPEHTHTDYTGSCYSLTCTKEEHAHIASCYTQCLEHTHTNACAYPTFEGYDASLWTLVQSDTVTVERNGSTVLNVYFDRTTFTLRFLYNSNVVATITDKWGASISDEFSKEPFSTTHKGYPWTCTDTKKYSYALQTLDVMPQFNADFNRNNRSTNTEKIITYYIQKPGTSVSENTWPTNSTNFTELKKVSTYFNYATYAEEYHEMVGYKRYSKSVSGFTYNNSDRKNFTNNKLDLYYMLESYTLDFYSGNSHVRAESTDYTQPLNIYADYTNPPLPDNVEEGSHDFAGWYLNPECTRAADLATMTMPASNLALYAKWVPNYHTVRLVLEEKADGVYGPEDSLLEVGGTKMESIEVLHGTIVFSGDQDPIPPVPTNGLYKFLGWFYDDDGVELMWDFEHHPVVKDTVIYAKWSSEVLVPYTIYYKDENGNDVAEPTISSSLAGHSLTVNAKVGLGLKPECREGYFPDVVSHSIELRVEDATDGVTYTFVYRQASTKKYYVHYLDSSNGNVEMTGSPVEHTSSYAVVTETFKSFLGDPVYKDHVPDAYQKTLVLSSDESENHIYFYYTKSDTDGVWHVEHLVQNRDEPTVYDSIADDGGVDAIGTTITPAWPPDLSIDGYQFVKAIITNGSTSETVTSWDKVKGTITKDGLSIQVYYDRIKYPYKIVYRNKDTGAEIRDPDLFKDPSQTKMYGSTVSAPTTLPSIPGYEFASSTSCTIVKDDPDNITNNIIYVYYTEQSIRLDFKVVGPDGCGTVNPEFTHVKVKSDPSASCTATPAVGYQFVGWYLDEACTLLHTTDEMLVLLKPDDGWAPATYYAKFEAGVAPLTIERKNGEAEQVYVYKIQKKDDSNFVIYVTITGNGSVTIADMPIAEYTITQQNDWSWRHDDEAIDVALDADGETATFDDLTAHHQWLNGNSPVEKNEKGVAP